LWRAQIVRFHRVLDRAHQGDPADERPCRSALGPQLARDRIAADAQRQLDRHVRLR
jgi:hypothetical protein